MTSSTRLPTVWPTRPVSQPLMTWPSPITVVRGVLRAQEESKTLPVRQITPVYWTAMSWPAFTTAPVPLIRGLTWRVFGAVVLAGILIVGPAVLFAAGAVTVGSAPPPLVDCVPETLPVVKVEPRSMTNTSVALGPMASEEWQDVPKPSLGGITASTRLPSFWPTSAVSSPGSSDPTKIDGAPWV